MVFRIFIILLVLNSLAFVVKADAAENDALTNAQFEAMSAQHDRPTEDEEEIRMDALTEIGSRLLRLRLFESDSDGKRYAYDSIHADHGIALVNEGACLDLKWEF
ncbi:MULTISPECIES: hypothetical protein [Marinobacter]|uniref:hypothetical protein n=1 Tax=Marinobacter TaxID=2742 RepID=UPI000DADF1F7|nr:MULTISPECIES: hypothetical protein [Marinobacter]